jgi:hypothetical protein
MKIAQSEMASSAKVDQVLARAKQIREENTYASAKNVAAVEKILAQSEVASSAKVDQVLARAKQIREENTYASAKNVAAVQAILGQHAAGHAQGVEIKASAINMQHAAWEEWKRQHPKEWRDITIFMDGLTIGGDVYDDWGPTIYDRYKHFDFPVEQKWLENYLSVYAKLMAERARKERFGSEVASSAKVDQVLARAKQIREENTYASAKNIAAVKKPLAQSEVASSARQPSFQVSKSHGVDLSEYIM